MPATYYRPGLFSCHRHPIRITAQLTPCQREMTYFVPLLWRAEYRAFHQNHPPTGSHQTSTITTSRKNTPNRRPTAAHPRRSSFSHYRPLSASPPRKKPSSHSTHEQAITRPPLPPALNTYPKASFPTFPYDQDMPLQLFHDVPDLTDSWRHAISSLDHSSQEIFLELFLHGQTRSQIAAERGTSRQNIANIVDRAIARVRRAASSGHNPPIADAIKNATHIIDAAGLELAFRLKRNPHHYSPIIAQQLANISAISPGQEAWAMAVILITPTPNMPRPSLEGMANDARQVAGQHLRGISQRHLRHHLTTWDQAHGSMAQFRPPPAYRRDHGKLAPPEDRQIPPHKRLDTANPQRPPLDQTLHCAGI